MACCFLAACGWEQFKTDVLLHEDTDQDALFLFFCEGVLENFPQLAIGQVSALLIVET